LSIIVCSCEFPSCSLNDNFMVLTPTTADHTVIVRPDSIQNNDVFQCPNLLPICRVQLGLGSRILRKVLPGNPNHEALGLFEDELGCFGLMS
jgi:hypothetical protein